MNTTLRIPVFWLLFPVTIPYWILRIALGCILYFFFSMDGQLAPACEILEVETILSGTLGMRIKVHFTPSLPLRLFGEAPKTLVVYRLFDLEESAEHPEYRDEDGHRIHGEEWLIITRAMNAKAENKKQERDLRIFKEWKKSSSF